MEEIRAKYYRELKKFMNHPLNFKGVHETIQENSIFVAMTERNADRFHRIYQRAEDLFNKLSSVQDQFKALSILFQSDHFKFFSVNYFLRIGSFWVKWIWNS